MKTILPLALLLTAVCTAQEANPFVNNPSRKAPASGESGESFLSLAEHILVPSDLLDAWLANHSLKDGADDLRAAAQDWIGEGKATLDYSALSAGTVGRKYSNESTLEQVYATEYEPAAGPGEWPIPTAFETRNLGYSVTGSAEREQDRLALLAGNSLCKMLPARAFDRLAEETRQPDDVFIPRFRSIDVVQRAANGEVVDEDPFAPSTPTTSSAPKTPSYPAGKTHLVIRADDDLPEPTTKNPLGDALERENVDPLPETRPVRLIFFRGDETEEVPASAEPMPEDYQMSVKMIEVDHRMLSAWLQERDLGDASRELGEAIEDWNESGKVKIVRNLSGAGRSGTITSLQDIKEVIYPTEYEPGNRTPSADGKSSQLEFATPTSYETRNVGATLDSRIEADPKGPLLLLNLDRVIHGGYSNHHRILRDGKWEVNVNFPRFSSNRWNSYLRLKRGEWMFVGSGAAYDEKGNFDPSRTVLAFAKVE